MVCAVMETTNETPSPLTKKLHSVACDSSGRVPFCFVYVVMSWLLVAVPTRRAIPMAAAGSRHLLSADSTTRSHTHTHPLFLGFHSLLSFAVGRPRQSNSTYESRPSVTKKRCGCRCSRSCGPGRKVTHKILGIFEPRKLAEAIIPPIRPARLRGIVFHVRAPPILSVC